MTASTVIFASLISQLLYRCWDQSSLHHLTHIVIIDGNQFLDPVVWPVSGTVAGLAASIMVRLGMALLRLERTMNLLEGGEGEGRLGERGWGGDGGRVGRGCGGERGGWGREGGEGRGGEGREGKGREG